MRTPRTRRTGSPAVVLIAAGAGAGALALGLLAVPDGQSPADTVSTDGDSAPLQEAPSGWAGENGGTTGGAEGDTVTVSSGDELLDALEADGPQVIEVSGSIEISGMNNVPSDTTVVGQDGAEITGGGLNVSDVSNVIIRNIAFADWDDDAVNVEEGATNIWVDHNSFTNGYDGAVDIKREADFITVSWNHFFDHDKTSIVGHDDGHTDDEGYLRVTYHHNYFDGTDTRHPRVRFGNPVHVYNNYYRDNEEYGVASTMDAGVLVEGNYFESVDNPTHTGYADSDDGAIEESDNVYDGSGEPEVGGSVESIPYDYTVDPAEDIPDIVTSGAGPGNI